MPQSPPTRPAPVVYWVNQFTVPPDQPGGTRHYDMAHELRRCGIDARLVASDLNLTTRAYSRRRRWFTVQTISEDAAGVPIAWLWAGSYSANDWRRITSMLIFATLSFIHLLRVEVRPGEAVVIGSSPHLFGAVAAWAAAKVRRVPFVVEIRDLWPESYSEMTGKTSRLEVRVMRAMADLLYRRSSAVVVLAPANRQHVIERGASPELVHCIPNGVDLERFGADGEAPVQLGRPERFTFVYAGAHGPANGLDLVVEACRLLQQRGNALVAVALIGDGPVKAELVKRASSLGLQNMAFCDPVPKAAVPAVLRTADAGLMVLAAVDLFSYGVSPNKLFDYLAADLPVVTNVPGWVAEIVESSGAGTAVPAGDASALADAMDAMARRQSGGEPFASGRRYVAEHYDRRHLARRLSGVLTAAASAGRPSR
jgi:glycosyltransferase involved in cell wall biosynthesis